MLVFERIRADLRQGLARFGKVACNALMQIPCDSGFLVMGDEMHLFCIGSAFPAFPLSPVPWFRRFPLFRLVQVLALSADHMIVKRSADPRISGDALLYSIKLQSRFLFYLLAICSHV